MSWAEVPEAGTQLRENTPQAPLVKPSSLKEHTLAYRNSSPSQGSISKVTITDLGTGLEIDYRSYSLVPCQVCPS